MNFDELLNECFFFLGFIYIDLFVVFNQIVETFFQNLDHQLVDVLTFHISLYSFQTRYEIT